MRGGVVWLERDRTLEFGFRFLPSVLIARDDSERRICLGERRVKAQRLIDGRPGFRHLSGVHVTGVFAEP